MLDGTIIPIITDIYCSLDSSPLGQPESLLMLLYFLHVAFQQKNSVNTSLQIQEVHFCSTGPASHVAGRALINVAREGRVGLCMERDPISQSILSVRHMEKNSC